MGFDETRSRGGRSDHDLPGVARRRGREARQHGVDARRRRRPLRVQREQCQQCREQDQREHQGHPGANGREDSHLGDRLHLCCQEGEQPRRRRERGHRDRQTRVTERELEGFEARHTIAELAQEDGNEMDRVAHTDREQEGGHQLRGHAEGDVQQHRDTEGRDDRRHDHGDAEQHRRAAPEEHGEQHGDREQGSPEEPRYIAHHRHRDRVGEHRPASGEDREVRSPMACNDVLDRPNQRTVLGPREEGTPSRGRRATRLAVVEAVERVEAVVHLRPGGDLDQDRRGSSVL